MSIRPWGVILAGGDGTRLRELSRLVSGDNRPKQFCTLFGNTSLLERTRARLAPTIAHDRTIFAVVRDHERFYRSELADVDESRIVVQPANRGTAAAIIYSLVRLERLDHDPLVAFFPADHYFANEEDFAQNVENAFDEARRHPELLVLLGAKPEKAETGYGWIEPGAPMEIGGKGSSLTFRVRRFWEKPSAPVAEQLLDSGCLWNTFVIVGRARTFFETIEAAAPRTLKTFRALRNATAKQEEMQRAAELYAAMPSGDFSREVLTRCPDRLAVLQMNDVGWGDLGTPAGVVDAIGKTRPAAGQRDEFNDWLAGYRSQLDRARLHPAGAQSVARGGH